MNWRKSLGVLAILDKNEPLRRFAGPGHWNDPDMLEVGNGMTESEDRAHFTMWCMMAAPLILGNDIRSMTKQTLDIITNREVIAIDQDPLYKSITAVDMNMFRATLIDYYSEVILNARGAVMR